jgi:spermidine/putrescine-binding protein
MSRENVSRRKFLKYVGAGGVAAAAVGAVGYGAYQYLAPRPMEPLVVVQWGGSYIEAQKPIADEFTRKTGIPIVDELHVGGSAAVISRINADLPSMKRHVIAAWNAVWAGMDKEGWLAPLTPDKVPVMVEYPDVAKYVGPFSEQIVGLASHFAGVAWFYREDLFPKDLQPFDDYDKLLDPRLKGKVMISDMIENVGCSMWLFALPKGGNEKNPEPGWRFLRELAEAGQIGIVYSSDTECMSALSTGDAWVSLGVPIYAVSLCKEGIPMGADKSENVKSELDYEGFCVTESPRKEDAYKFMDFFYQKENNERFASGIGAPATHPQAKTDPMMWKFYPKPEEVNKCAYLPDHLYIIQHLDEWQRRFEEEILPIIKR